MSLSLLEAGLRERAIAGGQTTRRYKSHLLRNAARNLDRLCEDQTTQDSALEYFKSYSDKLEKIFNYDQVVEACAYLATRDKRLRAIGFKPAKTNLVFPCKRCNTMFSCRKDLRMHRCKRALLQVKCDRAVIGVNNRSESPCSDTTTVSSHPRSLSPFNHNANGGPSVISLEPKPPQYETLVPAQPPWPISKRKRPGFRRLPAAESQKKKKKKKKRNCT